jgi:hypothetical protein
MNEQVQNTVATMSLPGFTAEASLYVVKEHYSKSAISTSSEVQVVPALPRRCFCGGYTGADGDWHIKCYCF